MAEIKEKRYILDNMALMTEWNWDKNDLLGHIPHKITYGSAKKVWWKCNEGHEWQASPNHRSKGSGCPICAQLSRNISRSKNWIAKHGSLADNNPILAKQWNQNLNGELTPCDVTASSSRSVYWRCEKGHEWEASIGSRNSGVGCPVCSGHRLISGINDLATLRPELAAEWHPTKNGNLKPGDIIAGTNKSIWWMCEKGHEWKARINNRINGNNCPICIGKKVLVGYNDLATAMPSLAKEWHPAKNGNLKPQDVTVGSNKKVWWQCEKGHEWQTSVSHRSNGRRCPKCFGESKTSFPEQVIFYYLSQVTTAYNRYMIDSRTEIDVYLPEYKIGIEYDGAYFHQGKKAIQREIEKYEKLKSLGIMLIRVKEKKGDLDVFTCDKLFYNDLLSSDAGFTSIFNELFKIVFGDDKTSTFLDIDIDRDRSEILGQYISSIKEKSLSVIYPNLANQWHPTKNGKLLPENVTASANKKVWWICEQGHEWQAMINSRAQGAGCPYCAGLLVLTGINDLATINPQLAQEWHPNKNGEIIPSNVAPNSNKKVWWMCDNGHEWEAVISHRNTRNDGCPICSGKKVLVGYNDLSTTHPKLAEQWHPTKNEDLDVKAFTAGSHKKVWWLCEKGHEWESFIYSRKAGKGCPYCAKNKKID